MFDLTKYASPATDTSYYKGIPVAERETVRNILKKIGFTGSQIRFEYRGPRAKTVYKLRNGRNYVRTAPSCRLATAKTFAVYFRNR